jgi:FixJ family two-component response regulator
MAEHYATDALTARELEVLLEIAAGNANKIVAQAVTIAVKRGIISLEV